MFFFLRTDALSVLFYFILLYFEIVYFKHCFILKMSTDMSNYF